jgi:cytochrome b561
MINRYNKISVLLHWSIGLLLIAQIFLGFWMEGVPKTPPGIRAQWFNFHKSMGIVLILLIVARLAWRMFNHPPALPDSIKPYQKQLAVWNHRTLYLCMVGMPVSGFLGSSFTPYPIKFFDIPLPRLWDASALMKDVFGTIHTSLAFVFASLVVIHILAALYHNLKDDGVFQRMLVSSPNHQNPDA